MTREALAGASGDTSWKGDGGRLSGHRQAGPCVSESGQSSRNKLGRKERWGGVYKKMERDWP